MGGGHGSGPTTPEAAAELWALMERYPEEAVDRVLVRLAIARGPASLLTRPLEGLRIAVIAPSFREAYYMREVTSAGARRACFGCTDVKLGTVDRAMVRADGALHMTYYGGHPASDHVSKAAERYGIPVVRVDRDGKRALRAALCDLVAAIHLRGGRSA